MVSTEEIHATLRRFIEDQEKLIDRVQSYINGVPYAQWQANLLGRTTASTLATTAALPTPSPSSTTPLNLPRDKEKASFETLPTELIQQCISHLDVGELITLRQMSRHFAELCAPELFITGFSLRPQRDDMLRLAKACMVPAIAKGIKQMTIYMGDMDHDQLERAIGTAVYMPVANKLLGPLRKLYNPETVHCDQKILEAIFTQLPNLTLIKTTSLECPWSQEWEDIRPSLSKGKVRLQFEAVWDLMDDGCSEFGKNHFLDPKTLVARHTSVLLATLKLPVPLKTLQMDSFPIDCFAQDFDHFAAIDSMVVPPNVELNQRIFDQMKDAVAGVEHLEIDIIGSGDPETLYSGANLGKAIAKFIGSMKKLKSLSMEWQVEEDVNEDFMRGWDTAFFGLHFKNLENLRMANLESPRSVVSKFILRHKATLKRLSWSIPDIDEDDIGNPFSVVVTDEAEPRTWRAIFTDFKEQLSQLKACELLDDSDYGNLYQANWEPESKSGFKRVPASKLLEMFVQGKIPWPMKKDNPHHYKGWQPKYSTNYDEFTSQSLEQLAELYSEEWETDKDTSDSDMDDSDDDEEDDSDEDDSDDFSEEGDYDMDVDDGDEWEDEDDDEEEMDPHFFDGMPDLVSNEELNPQSNNGMPQLLNQDGLVWGNLPPELVMAALAHGFAQEMGMDVD